MTDELDGRIGEGWGGPPGRPQGDRRGGAGSGSRGGAGARCTTGFRDQPVLRRRTLRITAVQLQRLRLPLEPPFHAAWDPTARRCFEATIVRVETDAGL